MSEMNPHDASTPGPGAEPSIETPVEDAIEGATEVGAPEDRGATLRVDELDPEAPLADALEQDQAVPADEDDYR